MNDKSPLIQTARKVNIAKQTWVENKILSEARSFEERLKVKATIGIFGVTFKPDIDDTRESPALKIVNNIIQEYGRENTLVCDPNISSVDGVNYPI